MPVDPNSGPWPEEFVDGHLSNIGKKKQNLSLVHPVLVIMLGVIRIK